MKSYRNPLILLAIGLIAYYAVSLTSFTTVSALYAPIAAGIVVAALASNLAAALGVSAASSLIGSITYLIYYWVRAPEEVSHVFSKLGLAAVMPIIYSIVFSLLAALAIYLIARWGR